MESLYVCLFSNGHIKVGRSIDPYSRVAAHADRVSCVGVELVKTHSTEAIDAAERRESILIGLCANSPGATRFKSEWFSGLEYDMVCIWADQVAARELEAPVTRDGHLFDYLKQPGSMTVSQLRKAMNELGADLRDDAQIRQWIALDAAGNFKRQPGAAYAMYLERATDGRVTRQAMRDDYDAIWPELADEKKQAA